MWATAPNPLVALWYGRHFLKGSESGNFCLLAELRWSRDRWVHWVGNALCPTLPAKSVLVAKLIPAIDALPHILRRAFYLFAPLSQLKSRLRVRDEESLWSVDRPFLSFCQSLSKSQLRLEH